VLNREFEKAFNVYLSKNDDMINTKVADVMRMNEKEE
jgi:hypothetical protein